MPASHRRELGRGLRYASRSGAICAIAGVALLVIGTWLHPSTADPNDAVAAFSEYAASRWWGAVHLTQLLEIIGILATLLSFAGYIQSRRGEITARIAVAGLVTSALAAALQAVDGVALKRMVDTWASARPRAQGCNISGSLRRPPDRDRDRSDARPDAWSDQCISRSSAAR